MSQLFDALSRGRQRDTGAPGVPGPTARRDAVLATLGYSDARRRLTIRRLVVAAGAALVGWAGWYFYVTPSVKPTAPWASAANRTGGPLPAPAGPRAGTPTAPAVPPGVPRIPSPSPAPTVATVATPEQVPRAVAAAPARSVDRRAAPLATPVTRTESSPPAAASSAPSDELELALYYHRAGDFENALMRYRSLLSKNELNAQVHNNLGLLYQEKNLLDESAREFQRALIINPTYARAHNNYGVTLLRQGNTDGAAAEFRAVLALEPRSVDALVNLALANKAAGLLDKAKEVLLSALNAAPRSAAAHYNLAVLYDDTNEAARAIEHYRAFLEHAGAEYASRASDVRARLAVLAKSQPY